MNLHEEGLHVSHKVFGENNAIQLAWACDDDHGCGVDEVVVDLELGELGLQRLGRDLAPQTRAGEDVRLVDRVHGKRGVCGERDLSRDAGDALHLRDAVDHGVPRCVLVRAHADLLARAEVRAADELAHDDHVDAACDLWLQGRVREQAVGREVRRADVGVQAQGLAEGQQTLFRANFKVDTPLRASDGTCVRE